MLRQISRRGKVEAALRDDTDLRPLGQILESPTVSVETPAQALSGTEETKNLKRSSIPQRSDYDMLLQYLNKGGVQYHSVYTSAYDPDTTYLRPCVHTHTEVNVGDRTYSTRNSHEGNSAIQFVNPQTKGRDTGFIERILSTPLQSRTRTFFLVQSHRRLHPNQEEMAPFHRFHDKYKARIFDISDSNQFVIIEAQHIVTHLSTIRRPLGTYGIARKTLVVCWSLDRDRRHVDIDC